MLERTITRICGYKNALYRLKKLGFVRVFSDNIAEAVGVTPSQVRKDFSIFAISGNRRGGYSIDELIEKINHILGKSQVCNVVVVGAGNIGLALMKYGGFEKTNMTIKAAFDIDPAKFSDKSDIPVLPLAEMPELVKRENVRVGVISVPDIAAQHVADLMVSAGIKGILNFAPILLRGGEDTVIKNVNLELELENIIYFVNAREKGAS